MSVIVPDDHRCSGEAIRRFLDEWWAWHKAEWTTAQNLSYPAARAEIFGPIETDEQYLALERKLEQLLPGIKNRKVGPYQITWRRRLPYDCRNWSLKKEAT